MVGAALVRRWQNEPGVELLLRSHRELDLTNQAAVEAFYHELDMVTLEDLTRGNCGLEALLNVPDTLADACPSPVARA